MSRRAAAPARRGDRLAARLGRRPERIVPQRRRPAGYREPARGRVHVEIRNTCAPERNTQLRACTTPQRPVHRCEAEGFAHHLLPDRPDVMCVEHPPTLRASKTAFPVLLSNGNLVEEGDLDEQAAISRSGTTRIPSRATCSRSSPPTSSRASCASAAAAAGSTCCRFGCGAA